MSLEQNSTKSQHSLRVILGGISVSYEFAIQRLITIGLENNIKLESELRNLINEVEELNNYGFSGAQFWAALNHILLINRLGYDNYKVEAKNKVDKNRLFYFDDSVESIIKSGYNFA